MPINAAATHNFFQFDSV